MRHAAIARVYAAAILELAREKGETEAVIEDLANLEEALAPETGLKAFLESPERSRDEKRRVLERVLADAGSPLTLRLLLLLVRKHREAAIGSVIEMFRRLRDEEQNILRGRLQSARLLDDAALAEFEAALGRSTGATVALKPETDEALLAGMVLHLADRTVDGSLRTRLERLRETLLTAEL